MKLPINQRDSCSLLPDGKPKNEPQPNAFSAETFQEEEIIYTPIKPEELLNGYRTLVLFVFIGMIIGAYLTTITFFALYGTAIERANLIADTDAMIQKMQYNTNDIRHKVQDNENIIKTVNENIDKLGTGIVSELKPKEAKIVNK